MKKIVLALVTAAMTVSCSLAQTEAIDSRDKFVLGAKVGANFSNVYDAEGDDFEADSKLGLAAGAFISVPLGTFLGVQPEVMFSQKGFRATGSFLGSNYEFTRTTNYIDVPLFIALKPVESFTFLIGPQYSFLVKQKDVFKSSFLNSSDEQQFSDDIRKNTLCLVAGFDINVRHFVFGARGGIDLRRNQEDGSSDIPRYKNAWLQGTIGFRIYN